MIEKDDFKKAIYVVNALAFGDSSRASCVVYRLRLWVTGRFSLNVSLLVVVRGGRIGVMLALSSQQVDLVDVLHT
jgi:RNase P/RNase MRP subunit POP5